MGAQRDLRVRAAAADERFGAMKVALVRLSGLLLVLHGLHVEPAAAAAKTVLATVAESTPDVDGKLDDHVWQTATVVTDFVQHEPREGDPPTEKTEVRILYTRTHLYVGARCFDSEPARILVSDSRRDSELTDMDAFWMVLDTYRDRQSGFVFGTNPAGIEYDGQVTNDGQIGAAPQTGAGQSISQRGSGEGFNKNWDGNWVVKTSVDDMGWVAEFAIPLTTLRFPNKAAQTWGINFARNIRRKNEQVYWSTVPRQWNLYRVSLAGELQGLQLKAPRNLKLTPYVLGTATRDYATVREFKYLGDVGADAKYSITPSMTLDLTNNTDFAQVEVDEQQVNLTRFNLFFPEKRPFFLENAGFFAVGTTREIELFFSRRIGLTDAGGVNPILGGGRLSGKIGRWSVGVLDMQTEARDRCALTASCDSAGTNFLVARTSRQFGRRSSIGGVLINKQLTGARLDVSDFNRTAALDGRLGIGDSFLASGFVAATSTRHPLGPAQPDTENGVAFNTTVEYKTRDYGFLSFYTRAGEHFDPEVGFMERREFSKFQVRGEAFIRPTTIGWLRELGPHGFIRRYNELDGFQQHETIHLDCFVEWQNGAHFSPAVDIIYEGVREPFEIFPGVLVPPGSYRHPTIAWRFNSDLSSPFAVSAAVDAGGFYSGTLRSYRVGVNWRYRDRLTTSTTYALNDARLPVEGASREYGGHFRGTLVSLRANYSFTPRAFVQSLWQYNDAADNWSVNLRFGWLNAAGTGLYVVYNETDDLEDTGLAARLGIRPGGPVQRAFILKFTREFQVLR
jgi:hypothetical protein